LRDHFDKILCERPRRGGSKAKNRLATRKYDDMPSKEGMKINHIRGWNGKELNEYLNPLYRYLNSKVGERWDDVYSEIRQMVGKNPNAVKGHILQHLYGWQGVELHVMPKGNKIYHNSGRWGYAPTELSNGQLYVNTDGILSRYVIKGPKKKSYAEYEEEKWMETARHLPNGNQARKINGIWFEITLTPILENQIAVTWSDVNKYTKQRYPTYHVLVVDVLGTRGEPRVFERKYGAKVYASSKKAMNSKDLKRYNLQND
jgi:hypothetical protein